MQIVPEGSLTTACGDVGWALDESKIDYCVANKHVVFRVELNDVTLDMTGAFLAINLFLWYPLVLKNAPVCRRHTLYNEDFTPAVHRQISDAIYKDLFTNYPALPTDLDSIIASYNRLYNFTLMKLGSCVATADIFSLEKAINHPDIRSKTILDIEKERKQGIHAIEAKLAKQGKELTDVLSSEKYKDVNIMYPYVRLNAVSHDQIVQVFLAGGARTDINDKTITTIIESSYFRGLTSIHEAAIDSLAAKKSIAYNKNFLKTSQYFNRKEQLLNSVIHQIYTEDCGSTITVPFEIHNKNYIHCLGKYIVDNGTTIMLTPINIKSYIGKMVNFRSVGGCRHLHRGGCCIVCGGEMLKYTHSKTAIGIHSAQTLIQKITQLLLSNKHVSRVASLVYTLAVQLQPYLNVMKNDLYLKSELDLSKLIIGIPFASVTKLADLRYVNPGDPINDQHFSSVVEMMVATEDGELLTPLIPMITTESMNPPYLSAEFLEFIIRNPDRVFHDDVNVWFKLDGFSHDKPLLKTITSNDSMPQFVATISKLLNNNIKKYTSFPEALRDLSNLIYHKIGANIFHIECMLCVNLITSNSDYRIPQVNDINNVKFGVLSNIIPGRSIGAMFAYERMVNYLGSPQPYVVPKKSGIFDPYIGLKT